MTDHQQAAIEAAEDALRADIWDGDPEHQLAECFERTYGFYFRRWLGQ